MKKILVTGGTGYIGSHTTVELQKQGYRVIIIDNLSNSNIEVLDGIEKITAIRPDFFQFDLCDSERLHGFFADNKDIAAVIHFAAYKAVGGSVNDPLKYYRNNLISLINILDNLVKIGKGNLVFSSSACVYGQPDELPVFEYAPIKSADSPYGNTKQISEEIIKDSVSAYKNLKAIALRYFNPIGAHNSALIGELPLGVPDNLVPFITQTAIGKREYLNIFGSDYDTPDGTAIRDYIHVVDLAKAHVQAVDRLLFEKNKDNYEIFNLGTGKGNSVMEVVKTFEDVNNLKLNYKIVNRRPGDVESVYADAKLAEKELGWKAERSLSDALRSAWEWEKEINKVKVES